MEGFGRIFDGLVIFIEKFCKWRRGRKKGFFCGIFWFFGKSWRGFLCVGFFF